MTTTTIGTTGDPGLFGPGSVAWRIHADPAMLVGGLRRDPPAGARTRAMAAVDQHSRFREDPWGRLERTTKYVVSTTYGTTDEAEEAAALVRRVHTVGPRGRPGHTPAVLGRRPRPAVVDPRSGGGLLPALVPLVRGSHRPGRRRPLRGRDGACGRAAGPSRRDGAAFPTRPRGLPAVGAGPPRHARPRDGLRIVLFPPMRLPYRPLWAIPTTAAIAILPGFARRMYRIPWVPPVGLSVRAAVFGLSQRAQPGDAATARAAGGDGRGWRDALRIVDRTSGKVASRPCM